MIKTVFVVFDSKAETFGQPMFAFNTAVGVRMFETAVNDEGSEFFHHPADYTLFEIGVWDAESAHYEPHAAHINHGTGLIHTAEGLYKVKETSDSN